MYIRKATQLILLFLSGLTLASAQDAIYKLDGITINGSFEYLNDGKVFYRVLGDEKMYKMNTKEVAVITSSKRNLAFKEGKAYDLQLNSTPYDLLYLNSQEVIPVKQFDLQSAHISYTSIQGEAQQAPITGVSVIVYTNNRILPLRPIPEVAEVLISLDGFKLPEESIEPNVEQDMAGTDTLQNQPQFAETPATPSKPLINQGPTPPVDKEKFRERALSKAKQFENYIVRILDKNTPRVEAINISKQVIPLFISDTSIVEVSSKFNPEKVQHPLRGYLNHLMYMDYTRIEIEWVDINYVGNIYKGPDSLWYGTITYTQTFKGYKGEMLTYEDTTTKRMTVILKTYERTINGVKNFDWDVFLSNISVEHTS